jgi:hypothetical protein
MWEQLRAPARRDFARLNLYLGIFEQPWIRLSRSGETAHPMGFSLSRLFRQQYSKGRPLALLALHRDGTEMGLDNALDNGKT